MMRIDVLLFCATLSLLTGSLTMGCGDGGDDGSGDGDGDSTGDGDGDSTGDGDGDSTGDGDGDVEAPTSCSILEEYVGEYAVSGPATGDDHRGESTADHARGTIRIEDDYAVDFDTNIAFEATDIVVCYDRTTQDFDRRVQISFGADDDGEVINLYLDDALEVVEIQYRHNSEGVNVRATVE